MRLPALTKRIWLPVLGLLFIGGTALAQDPWVDPNTIPVPELNKIQEIKPKRVELSNGMIVYFLEDHDFPLVDMRALIRVGGIYEPADKVGLASITGQVMRTGGSTKTDGDALDEMLESMGASVEVNIGDTQGTASVSTLSEDLATGVRILSEILRTPAFPEDKIDLAKKQERTAIASRNDEHLDILFREMSKLIYGPDHPYARNTEYATIDAITRDDLVAFHKEYFHPDRMIMTVYGDFKTGDVEKLLKKSFEGWPKSTKPLPPDPEVGKTTAIATYVADKADLTNSAIVVGHEGMRMDNPDYAAMQVYHEVMGGGFSSRLMNEIRATRGLAYATGSFAGAGLHHPGPQGFYVITQADSTMRTLRYLKEEVAKSLQTPFTDKEIQNAKDSILNSLVFTLSSKGSVLNRMATYEFYGYPQDFLTRYQAAVKNMTADEVLAAAKRNVRYPEVTTLIVGEKAKFKVDLEAAGPYRDIDITIPEPAAAAIPAATEADFKKGQELLAMAAEASGGDVMASLEDLTYEENGVFSVQGMELQISTTTVMKFPGCERSEQKLPMGTMVQSICGDQAWMDMMQGPQAMPADMRQDYEAEKQRELLYVLTHYKDMELQALPGEEEVDGRPASVVYVHSDQVKEWKIFLDKENHRVVRMEYRDKGMTGNPVLAQLNLSDYKDVQGMMWPYKRVILHDGETLATLDVTSIKVNSGVMDSVFSMPQ